MVVPDPRTILTMVGVAAALVAAGCWLRAFLAPVPDNIETFDGSMQWAGRLNNRGAAAASIAAVCAVLLIMSG
jgi:hypothetical protein